MDVSAEALRGYLEYLRDMGLYDLYRNGDVSSDSAVAEWWQKVVAMPSAAAATSVARPAVSAAVAGMRGAPPKPQTPAVRPAVSRPLSSPSSSPEVILSPPVGVVASSGTSTLSKPQPAPASPPSSEDLDFLNDDSHPAGPFAPPAMPLISFNNLAPLPAVRVAPEEKAVALQRVRETIGDCTRCPLAFAGRHTIVFADGDPNAQLMFVGEGPGADEDASGIPFVGKAGQLLNNMMGAMGLKREQVFIANVVKCRPPKNRTPEPIEANTCSQFLLQQVDIVQPKVIVALGATAATYLLGVRRSLSGLRGHWHDVRGAKCAVTFHPAYLLRDPRQKGEAWKDLQRVMAELGLKAPARG